MKLAQLRRSRGHSQRSLAKAAGVSPTTVYQIENGLHPPNPSTLAKLARGLGVEPEDVLEAVEGPLAPPPALAHLTLPEALRSLDREDQVRIALVEASARSGLWLGGTTIGDMQRAKDIAQNLGVSISELYDALIEDNPELERYIAALEDKARRQRAETREEVGRRIAGEAS